MMNGFKYQEKWLAGLLLVCISGFSHAGSDTFVDTDVSVGLDDNVTRSAFNEDIEHDLFVSFGASLGHEIFQGESGTLSGSLDVTASQFIDFEGLSNYTAGGTIKYVFGFSGGFGAPWFGLSAKYFVSEFNSFLRDSNTFIGTFTVGKRFDDKTNLRTAIAYKTRDSDGLAFDTEDVSFFANVDWTLDDNLTLYTTYKIQEGDVVSTSTQSSLVNSLIGVDVINAAGDYIELDDVFTGKLNYRLDSTTHIVTVGLNLARDLDSAYDLSARYLKSETDVGLEYEDLTVILSYFYRFGFE